MFSLAYNIMKYPAIKDLIFTVVILLFVLAVKTPYLSMILAAIVVIIYASINEKRFISAGFKRPVSWLTSFIQSLFLATVIGLIVIYFIQPAIDYITQSPVDLTIFNPLVGNPQLLLHYIMIGWIVGGVSEELVFRGFLLNKIINYIPGNSGIALAILLTSSLFGFLHNYQGISGQLTTGIVGAMLAAIYFLSGKRLVLTILTHGMINTISFLIIFFDLHPN